MVLKIYVDPCLTSCKALILFMKTNNIDHMEVVVNPSETNTTKTAKKYKLPVMDDDGYVLTETVSIFKYLCGIKKTDDHWYPKEFSHRQRVDEYLAWQNRSLSLVGRKLLEATNSKSKDEESETNTADLECLRDLVHEHLSVMEGHFLEDRDYISGESISIADIWAACEITSFSAHVDFTSRHQILDKWFNRVKYSFPSLDHNE